MSQSRRSTMRSPSITASPRAHALARSREAVSKSMAVQRCGICGLPCGGHLVAGA